MEDKKQRSIFDKPMIRRAAGVLTAIATAEIISTSLAGRKSRFWEEVTSTASAAVDRLPRVQVSEKKEIGKGKVKIGLNYAERTNLDDPEVKANVDQDIQFIESVLAHLPILGYPEIGISAQSRYKYEFPAITPGNLGSYQKERNYFFINMEEVDPIQRIYLINHEMGGHYLSVLFNDKNLEGYIDDESGKKAKQAEIDLLNQIRRYKTGHEKRWEEAPELIIDQKLRDGLPVTLEEIIEAANVYPGDIFHNPQNFIAFRDNQNPEKVKERAESELAGEFAGWLLTAQQLGLFDGDFEHPVLKIFKEVKKHV